MKYDSTSEISCYRPALSRSEEKVASITLDRNSEYNIR